MQDHENLLKELEAMFKKIRDEKSYKLNGVPNASIKLKCSVCGRETEFAHCVYDLKNHRVVCFRCFEQPTIRDEDYELWVDEFSYDNYF